MAEVYYRETQYFRQDWLWGLVLVGAVPAFLLGTVAVLSDASGHWTDQLPWLAAITGLTLGPLVLFWRAHLSTEVRDDGLALKLWPLHWSFRTVSCADISDARAVEVAPIRDFGGVGIRLGLSLSRTGIVTTGPLGYVVERGPGVRIEQTNGRAIVLTTATPDALLAALERTCG